MRLTFLFLLIFSSSLLNAQKLIEENVSIPQAKGNLAGSLLYPESTSPLPLIILISGSGPTDRDGNNPYMKNNSLKLLARALAEQKIAVFRFDKRGVGASAGAAIREDSLLFTHYVEDVKSWVRKFSTDKRFDKIILAGHSEGSLLGMVATVDLPEIVDGFISIAGAGRPANKILREQLSQQPATIRDPAFLALDTLEMGLKIQRPPIALFSLFRPSVQPYLLSWFKYDPAQLVKKITVPVQIIQGSKDLQVQVEDAKILLKASPKSLMMIIPEMNHVLKRIKGGNEENQAAYSNPELGLAPGLMESILAFLKNKDLMK